MNENISNFIKGLAMGAANVIEYLLGNFEVLTMAFFFGLIAMSVISVGRTVKQWDASTNYHRLRMVYSYVE